MVVTSPAQAAPAANGFHLSPPNLTDDDLRRLAAGYITPDVAQAARLSRVDSAAGAALVGRRPKASEDYSGIVFPYVWPGEKHPRCYRLRRDNPELEQKPDGSLKEKGKYLSAPGEGNKLYFAPSVTPEMLADVSVRAVIVEGEKKTLAMQRLFDERRERAFSAGTSGIYNWRGTVGKQTNGNGHRVAVKGVIPDFDRIKWQGRQVEIIFDADAAANSKVKAARRALAEELTRRGAKVRILDMPDAAETGCKGVDDLLGAKGPDFVTAWLKQERQRPDAEPPGAVERPIAQWPAPLGPAAYHGVAGEVVRAIDPHTEADPAAVLIQFLVAFGNLIGRAAYFTAEAKQHFTNLFAVIVGNTAKGRKGSSWSQVMYVLSMLAEAWTSNCVASGLASGEGLVWAVRDQIEKLMPHKDGPPKMIVVDEGVSEKRLLTVEEEFSSVMKVATREGNTLSATIRKVWDDGNVKSLTKSSPAKATGAHVSIVGHITKDELRRRLDETEAANGFANRFLWFCARRSKCLPDGGDIKSVDFGAIIGKLEIAVENAKLPGELKRDDEARALWHEVYPELSEGKPGLLGAVTSRAEAQVMRLACLYALLDADNRIMLAHLQAALEVWRYAEDSARFIFGDSLGDPVADTILAALREAGEVGLSRTDISGLFKRHAAAGQINSALQALAEAGRAQSRKEKNPHGEGRDVEKWFAPAILTQNAGNDRSLTRETSELSEGSQSAETGDGDVSLNSLVSQTASANEEREVIEL
jgi:hypothetical protein